MDTIDELKAKIAEQELQIIRLEGVCTALEGQRNRDATEAARCYGDVMALTKQLEKLLISSSKKKK